MHDLGKLQIELTEKTKRVGEGILENPAPFWRVSSRRLAAS
jgi:hypothetical protein